MDKISNIVEQQYIPHLVAFIDTIGYKAKFEPLKQNRQVVELDVEEVNRVKQEKVFITEFYDTFISVLDDKEIIGSFGMKRMLFSDNVLLAIPINYANNNFRSLNDLIIPIDLIHKMFAVISALQLRCLARGWLIRGALDLEYLFLNDSFVAGRGLLETYQLEQEAKSPRVILGNNIRNYIMKTLKMRDFYSLDKDSVENEINQSYLIDREPDKTYLNCYQFLKEMKKNPKHKEYYQSVQDQIQKVLEQNYRENKNNATHRERAEFLINNFNEFVLPIEKIDVAHFL